MKSCKKLLKLYYLPMLIRLVCTLRSGLRPDRMVKMDATLQPQLVPNSAMCLGIIFSPNEPREEPRKRGDNDSVAVKRETFTYVAIQG